MVIENILARYGIKRETLSEGEQDTLEGWAKGYNETELHIEDVRKHIERMIISVENELTEVGLTKENDTFLKARLKNYLMLREFVASPERAKEYIESQIKGLRS